ncbi:MAG: hypothetical protein EBS38_08540, partial [Actinobacteria bacterium]|nr:hypothetical protein [Actinomycetota bacterium]
MEPLPLLTLGTTSYRHPSPADPDQMQRLQLQQMQAQLLQIQQTLSEVKNHQVIQDQRIQEVRDRPQGQAQVTYDPSGYPVSFTGVSEQGAIALQQQFLDYRAVTERKKSEAYKAIERQTNIQDAFLWIGGGLCVGIL